MTNGPLLPSLLCSVGIIEPVSVLEPVVLGQRAKLRELVVAEFAFEGRHVGVLQEVGHHSLSTVEHLVADGAVAAEEHALVLIPFPAALDDRGMNLLVGVAG